MRATRRMIATGMTVAALLSSAAVPANAACTRLGFSVNDYGKEGPIRDAKALLDKYVAKWAADRNIAKYRTGPKSVNCELFLDVIVFDEHTCRAEATVCWDGPPLAKPLAAGAAGETPPPAVKAPAPKAANVDGAAAGPANRAQAPAGAISVKPAKIETGTLPSAVPPVVKPAAVPVAVPAAVAPKAVAAPAPEKATVVPVAAPAAAAPNAADQAVLAAEKAAAAAERAALAAERAAAAAAKLEPAAKP